MNERMFRGYEEYYPVVPSGELTARCPTCDFRCDTLYRNRESGKRFCEHCLNEDVVPAGFGKCDPRDLTSPHVEEYLARDIALKAVYRYRSERRASWIYVDAAGKHREISFFVEHAVRDIQVPERPEEEARAKKIETKD